MENLTDQLQNFWLHHHTGILSAALTISGIWLWCIWELKETKKSFEKQKAAMPKYRPMTSVKTEPVKSVSEVMKEKYREINPNVSSAQLEIIDEKYS